MTNFDKAGTPIRPWYELRSDHKIHGLLWFTDEEALRRLTRGERWMPAAGAEALVLALAAELPCDGSGCTYDASGRPAGLCRHCEGLGCEVG